MRLLLQAALLASATAALGVQSRASDNTFGTLNPVDNAFYSKSSVIKVTGLTTDKTCVGADNLAKITDAAGVDVSAKIPGSSLKAASTNCILSFADLPDGKYNVGSLAVVIDRTAPTGMDAAATETIFTDSGAFSIKVPTTMFKDTITNAGALKINSATGSGFTLAVDATKKYVSDGLLNRAATTALTAGDYPFNVVAEDAAGNTVTKKLTVRVRSTVEKPVATIEVQDVRGPRSAVRIAPGGADSSMYTGSPAALTAGKLPLTVTVSFADKMQFKCASTALTLSSADDYDLVYTGTDCANSAVKTAAARSFKFTATSKTTTLVATTIKVTADAFVRETDSAPNSASGLVTVVLATNTDAGKFLQDNTNSMAAVAAAINRDFLLYVPANIFKQATGPVEILSFSSSTSSGLTIVPGPIGRAIVTGKATSIPARTFCVDNTETVLYHYAKFSIKARDASGAEATGLLCIPVTAAPGGDTAALTFATTALTAAETTPVALDAGLAVTGDFLAASKVVAYLETPQDVTVATKKEVITCTACTGDADAATTNFVYKMTKGSLADSAAVKTLLADLKYKNEYEGAISTSALNRRTARFAVLSTVALTKYTVTTVDSVVTITPGTVDTDYVSVVGSRPVAYTVTNDIPNLAASGVPDTWVEADAVLTLTGTPITLFSTATLSDDDDAYFRGATIAISKVAEDINVDSVTTSVIPCDAARDSLFLPATINNVKWEFSSVSCVLTISPLVVGGTIAKDDLLSTIKAVEWKSLDIYNANGFDNNTGTKGRKITLTVTDNASSGNVGVAASKSIDALLKITTEKSKPVWQPAKLFGPGGLFSSSDANANIATFTDTNDNNKVYSYKKITILGEKNADGTMYIFSPKQVSKVSFDFNKVKDTVYAQGALVYPDQKEGPVIPASSVTVAYDGGDEDASDKLATVFSNELNTVPQLWQIPFKPMFMDGADPGVLVADDPSGTYTLTVTYDGAAIDFEVDVRIRACPFDTFTAATQYPDPAVCASTKSYMDALKAAQAPVAVTAGADRALGNIGTFGDKFDAVLAGTKTFAALREEMRGSAKVALPKDAVSTPDGMLALVARPLSTTEIDSVPAPSGGVVDTSVGIKLEPAGTKFVKPVKVCIFVGTTAAGFIPTLGISSQVDANDISKGFKAWESMNDQSYDANTGEVCGYTDHFSVAAPILVPQPASDPTSQKLFAAGASCPNDCSGKGYCREKGQCVCFEGFTGYDCASRVCPSAESWDVDAENTAIHKPAECANRGVCDRKSGQCACYAGFDGAACDRTACPNSCSNHGKCRLVSELSTSYSSWEAGRMQVCVCDAGYTGADCSQRTCPFGDDPESVCNNEKRQIQRVLIDFKKIPGGADADAANSLNANDELALSFTAKDGKTYYAPTVGDVWPADATAAGVTADKLAKALKSLPQFAVSDVKVTAGATGGASMYYDVEFSGTSQANMNFQGWDVLTQAATSASGNTVSGDQTLMKCLVQDDNIVGGCTEAGCRPVQKQPRLVSVTANGLDDYIEFNAGSILEQPYTYGTQTFDSYLEWGVTAQITFYYNAITGDSYYSAAFQVYGQTATLAIATAPVPPKGLRKNVPIGYGLHINFKDFETANAGSVLTPAVYSVSWRLPKCTVSAQQAADADYESFECSNRGVCDRKAGQCVCFNGYAGYNCGQQTILL